MSLRRCAQRLVAAILLGMMVGGCGSVVRDESTGEFVDDAAITAKVKARLAQEPGVRALAISVDTYKGVVLLHGFLDSEDQRDKAIAAARSVAGAREVRGDGLVLRPRRPGS